MLVCANSLSLCFCFCLRFVGRAVSLLLALAIGAPVLWARAVFALGSPLRASAMLMLGASLRALGSFFDRLLLGAL